MLHQLGKHIWFLEPDHRSDRPVLGYIQGDTMAFAVDAGASRAHVGLFYEQLQGHQLPLPTLTGISHSHWDHSYGAAAVHGLVVASDRCTSQLKKEAQWAWTPEAMKQRLEQGEDIPFGYYSKLAEYPDCTEISIRVPDLAISGNAEVDLGGVHVQILYCGGPHCDDHIVFYIPEERFLFLGDASGKELFKLQWDFDPNHPEVLQDTLAALPFNLPKLEKFVTFLEGLDFTHCFFAHADAPWTRAELLDDLYAALHK